MKAARWQDLLSRRFDTPQQAAMTRLVSQRAGAVVAAVAFNAGLSPNAVTLLGLALSLAGCLCFVVDQSPEAWIAAALLWQLAFAFDCADGQLARATGRSSAFGAWLDVACDHVRQAAIAIAALIVCAPALGWFWAAASALTLAAGLSVYLHTATMMHALKPPALRAQGSVSVLRGALQTVADTPVMLLTLCMLRPWEMALAAGASAYGLLLLLRAVTIARLRLAP
jgi:phosphatidylglycerophosphate synthase